MQRGKALYKFYSLMFGEYHWRSNYSTTALRGYSTSSWEEVTCELGEEGRKDILGDVQQRTEVTGGMCEGKCMERKKS